MTALVAKIRENGSPLSPRPFLALTLLAIAVSSASAQVAFTGNASTQNFGAQAIASPSATQSFTFSISAGTTVGSIAAVTTGISNLDFAVAAGSTCAAQHYATATTCVVNVTFTPVAAGLRLGAVLFFSKAKGAGAVLGSTPMYGVGLGPQIAFNPGTVSAVYNLKYSFGLVNPIAMAADAAGNLFVLDTVNGAVKYRLVEIPASGATPTVSYPAVDGEALYLPSCIALDGAGDLFIGDFYDRIVEVPIGGGPPTAIYPSANGTPLGAPSGLVVDGVGNLYIADFMNNRVLEIPAGGGATIALAPSVNGVPISDPHGLTIDADGDLFIADLANDRVVEIPIAGGPPTAIAPTVNGESLQNPVGVAVDAAGDLYIADNVNQRVVEVPTAGGKPTSIDPVTVLSGTGDVYGVALDGSGNLFILQQTVLDGPRVIEEIEHANPAAIAFPTATFLHTTDEPDGVQTLQALNIGNQPLALTAISYPADFTDRSGDEDDCTSSTTLNPGQQCELTIDFSPVSYGALSERILLTDNSLNASGAQQAVTVSGSGLAQSVLLTPAPGSRLSGSRAQFTWTAATGVTRYALFVGTTGPGSKNILNTGYYKTLTVWAVSGLPMNGATVYARLVTDYGKVEMYSDYTFTAASSTQKTPVASPVRPGTPSPGSHAQMPPLPIPVGSGLK
jgi:hypothetical protein